MKHLDLFSGIGGFALATERVWPNIEHIFCEIDPFCQEVLKKHWPNSKIYGDIKELTKSKFTSNTGSKESLWLHQQPRPKSIETGDVHILTGGFPCQPFSQAGRRKGKEDDRYLWPGMFRVIREFQPDWIIVENVVGIISMVLDEVCLDLENEGYEIQPFIIPAVAVNAPHRRDRVWIVANSKLTSDSTESGLERRSYKRERSVRQSSRIRRHKRPDWNENWLKVATRLCRVDDGLPRRLDRNPRLKALGNAIVPQVAEEILRAISELSPVYSLTINDQ